MFLGRIPRGARLAELRDVAEDWRHSAVVAVFKSGVSRSQSVLSLEGQEDIGRAIDDETVADVTRMMERTAATSTRSMERSLTFLATCATTAPFVGLFGTVWGIMESFGRLACRGRPTWRATRRESRRR